MVKDSTQHKDEMKKRCRIISEFSTKMKVVENELNEKAQNVANHKPAISIIKDYIANWSSDLKGVLNVAYLKGFYSM